MSVGGEASVEMLAGYRAGEGRAAKLRRGRDREPESDRETKTKDKRREDAGNTDGDGHRDGESACDRPAPHLMLGQLGNAVHLHIAHCAFDHVPVAASCAKGPGTWLGRESVRAMAKVLLLPPSGVRTRLWSASYLRGRSRSPRHTKRGQPAPPC